MKFPFHRHARARAGALALALGAAAGPAPAADKPPVWGAPAAPPRAASEAVEEDPGRANGDYFHDFGELIVRVRSVGWLQEICADAFPANAELQRRAYADWLHAHRAFVDEMEGQFALLEKRWADASHGLSRDGLTMQALQARLDANRDALREDFLARPKVTQQKRCDAYPQLLLSRPLDLEKSQADLVKSVRMGPR